MSESSPFLTRHLFRTSFIFALVSSRVGRKMHGSQHLKGFLPTQIEVQVRFQLRKVQNHPVSGYCPSHSLEADAGYFVAGSQTVLL